MSRDVVIVSVRCADAPVPSTPATKIQCAFCGESIWIPTTTKDEVERIDPDVTITGQCTLCDRPEDGRPMAVLPAQVVEWLRTRSEREVSLSLALSAIAGHRAVADVLDELRADPNGPLAAEFRNTLVYASRFVGGIGRRN